MAKMAASITERGQDTFRTLFKYYKSKNPPPDFSDVVDFSKGLMVDKIFDAQLNSAAVSEKDAQRAGLRSVKDWKAFGLKGYPGFILISNPFLPASQKHWIKQCLKVYPQKPNVCNLDMHMATVETEHIWERSADLIRKNSRGKTEPKTLLEKLRWVTLGYHYSWDTKTYSAAHHTTFPSDLADLSQVVARACGFPGFTAEAGILNYYHCSSSLGIHVDESELDHSWPLLSFSFGQSAVFLLGGSKIEEPVTAMFVHSGDVMVMSGASRLLFHAVPRIVAPPCGGPLPPCLSEENVPEGLATYDVSQEDWEVCVRYIQASRVNMTVRQVLGPGQTFPLDTPLRTSSITSQDSYHLDEELEPKRIRKTNHDSDTL